MVIWKGIDLKTKGIIVEHTPKISKAKKKIDVYQVDGRNGFVSVDTNTYEPFSVSLECHINESVNKDEVLEYLDGYGTLSFDGEREYTAIINNAIELEKVMSFKRFAIQFLVNPIAEDIEETEIIVDHPAFSFEVNDTYYDIYPILEIECVGDVTVTMNSQMFYLYDTDDTYTLDCKNKVIVNARGNSTAHTMLNDFPKIIKGINNIFYTGNITSFKIRYKRTYH